MHAAWTTPVTQALRSGSVEALRAELLRLLVAGWDLDLRDLLVGLAPYHDCAARLGVDPAALFAEVSAAGPPELRDAVRGFGSAPTSGPRNGVSPWSTRPTGRAISNRSVRTLGTSLNTGSAEKSRFAARQTSRESRGLRLEALRV